MKSNNGWIMLHRKIRDWEWYQDSIMLHLFIHLLLSANHEKGRWRGVEVQRGQLVTGRNSLNRETGITETPLRSRLKKLEDSGEITIQPTNKYSIITIVNYDLYQKDGKKVTSNNVVEQPSTNNQITTNNNIKNEKNVKNIKKENNNNKAEKNIEKIIIKKSEKKILKDSDLANFLAKLPPDEKNICNSLISQGCLIREGFQTEMLRLKQEYEIPDLSEIAISIKHWTKCKTDNSESVLSGFCKRHEKVELNQFNKFKTKKYVGTTKEMVEKTRTNAFNETNAINAKSFRILA